MSSNSDSGIAFSCRLERNLAEIKKLFGGSADVNIVKGQISGVKCAVVTLEGMVSSKDLAKMLFNPLMEYQRIISDPEGVYRFISEEAFFSAEQKVLKDIIDVGERLCSGFAVIFVNGVAGAMGISAQGFDKRSVSEPDSEANIKGCHEAFSDSLRTSMSLIRRRIKNPRLRFEMFKAGSLSKTELCIVYIDGQTPEELRKRVKQRLQKIKLPLILTSGSIVPFISENAGSFFSGASTTERPDVLAAKINEGRIGVLIDGVPYAVVCPTLFIENFQTVDDYEEKPYFACYQRWIRYIAFFIAAFLPGLYVAAATFHPEVLSRPLLLSLIASEENTPYSLVAELFIVIIMFEILREAGLRLPKTIGGAVSIVGGLVIGDAAVSSGLISAPLLIIIGITATSSFVLPSLNPQTTILRLAGVALGGLLGFFGIAILMTATLVNACVTDSFAVPYLAPVSPFTFRALRDVVTRVGFRRMEREVIRVEDLEGSEFNRHNPKGSDKKGSLNQSENAGAGEKGKGGNEVG